MKLWLRQTLRGWARLDVGHVEQGLAEIRQSVDALQATGTLDTTLVFAILFLLTIIGLALNTIVEVAEYLMTPWRRGRSDT